MTFPYATSVVTPAMVLLARAIRDPQHARTALKRLKPTRIPTCTCLDGCAYRRHELTCLSVCLPLCAEDASEFEWALAGYGSLWALLQQFPEQLSLQAASSGTLCEVINGGFSQHWRWPGKEIALPKATKKPRLTAVDIALQGAA